MKVIAGTSKGVFSVDNGQAGQRLESRGVRELTCCAGRLFAGTGAGLFVSDDQGAGWQPAGLEATEVWQVRAAADGTLYAGTQPAGLYRSRDRGDSWEALESFTRAPGANDWCIPVDPPLPGRARALVIDQNNGDRIRVGVEVGGILSASQFSTT